MTKKSGYLASRTGRQSVIQFGFHIRLESPYFRNVDIYEKKSTACQVYEGYMKLTDLPIAGRSNEQVHRCYREGYETLF